MKKQVIRWATPVVLATLWVVACKKDDNTTPQNQTLQVTATLNGQGVRPVTTSSLATGSFTGTIDPSTYVMTYTLTYSTGLTPTSAYLYRITNVADSSGVRDLSLISGLFDGGITGPGSGSTTSPGSGTSTGVGSGTSTGVGSGTSTGVGSGTSTGVGSGTSTGTGSGTATGTGSGTATGTGTGSGTGTTGTGTGTTTGTGSTTVTSPYSGTVTLTAAKVDSMRNGYYYISIGTGNYPNGEIRGRVRVQ